MLKKEKTLVEKGYRSLKEKLGEEKADEFLRILSENQMDKDAVRAVCDSLEEERKKKAAEAEAARAAEPEFRKISDSEFQLIREEYAEYLERKGIKYRNFQGFTLWIGNPSERGWMIGVMNAYHGGIKLSCYVGRLLTEAKRPVRRLEKLMQKWAPGYEVYEETYHNYSHEISLELSMEYTTIENLHREVEKLGEVSKKATALAIEAYPGEFEH